jgi:hypothetical protein
MLGKDPLLGDNPAAEIGPSSDKDDDPVSAQAVSPPDRKWAATSGMARAESIAIYQ